MMRLDKLRPPFEVLLNSFDHMDLIKVFMEQTCISTTSCHQLKYLILLPFHIGIAIIKQFLQSTLHNFIEFLVTDRSLICVQLLCAQSMVIIFDAFIVIGLDDIGSLLLQLNFCVYWCSFGFNNYRFGSSILSLCFLINRRCCISCLLLFDLIELLQNLLLKIFLVYLLLIL